MKDIRVNGYVGKIYHLNKEDRVVNVRFPRSEFSQGDLCFTYGFGALKPVLEEDAKPILETMEANFQKSVEEGKAKVAKLLNDIKRIPISDREYWNKEDKVYFETNMNFVKLFKAINSDGTPSGTGQNFPNAKCCSLTKTTDHILVHIPKDWLNYYGYNVIDLRMWLKFLSTLDSGFKAYYLGESTMSEAFGEQVIQDQFPKFDSRNHYMTKDMPCYLVMLESTGNIMLNYMHFIMIRYMYNIQYWNIPTIALQLKKALGSNITPWESIIIAHMNDQYHGYYALMSNNGESIAIPSSRNSLQEVTRKLKQAGSGMNSSFVYTPESIIFIRSEIRGKNYEAILKRLEEWRKK
jgi:hypothetical protein